MKQTFLLMIASLLARFLGLIYQTLLSRTIGPQGLGLYQMTFTIYMAALTLASAGLSQSISKFTSEFLAKGDTKNARKNFNIALTLVLITSTTICIFIFLSAPKLAQYLYDDNRLILPFRLLIVAIMSVAISQVFQGYFQGQKNMLPTATSQILEQIIRILSIYIVVIPLLQKGVVAATSGAILGMGVAEFTGLVVLISFFILSKRKSRVHSSYTKTISSPMLLKSLLLIALPIGFGSLVSTVNYSLSTLIIPRAMMIAGFTKEFAVESLGYFSGMAMPLLFFPTVFTFPIALSLLPGVSEAMAVGNNALVKQRINLATKFTIVLGFYITLILKIYSDQLPFMIFGYKSAGYMVSVLAYSALFLYPQQIFTAILQGLGRPTLALRNLVIFTVANLVSLLILVSRFGIIGAAYTFIIVNILAFIIDLSTIRTIIHIKIDVVNWLIKPGISLLTAYKLATTFLNVYSFSVPTTIMNILLTSVFFILAILLSTTFSKSELSNTIKLIKK